MNDVALCSNCFRDQGLRLDAERMGLKNASTCPNCGSKTGSKLNADLIESLAFRFFVWGTLRRFDYGAAPMVQFNQYQRTNIRTSSWIKQDIQLIEQAIGVGFFDYGPRSWMMGEVEPLEALQDTRLRASVIDRILEEYPTITLHRDELFYRIRTYPDKPEDFGEYDSPPLQHTGKGRLDSSGFPVLYGSQDLEVCVHECRVTAEDEIFVATLSSVHDLRLLDLSALLQEEDVTEFESLDMAVHMLFLAGKHAYDITRSISLAAFSAAYDGIVYPSYFSLLRTGYMPFETIFGISTRQYQELHDYEEAKTISNLALFGRPVAESRVDVVSINKLILSRVEYGFHFGPVSTSS